MRPRCPLDRNTTTAVYTTTLVERGRLVTVFDVRCQQRDCEDRSCLDSFRSRGKARRLANGHRHCLVPGGRRRLRRDERRRSA
jgi:hypothetical protein